MLITIRGCIDTLPFSKKNQEIASLFEGSSLLVEIDTAHFQ